MTSGIRGSKTMTLFLIIFNPNLPEDARIFLLLRKLCQQSGSELYLENVKTNQVWFCLIVL